MLQNMWMQYFLYYKTTQRKNILYLAIKSVSFIIFLNLCLDYLDIRYEVVISNNDIRYINKDNNFEFIASTSAQFRVHDLIGIRGDNKKITEQLAWKPTKTLEQICESMLDFELRKK